MPVREHHTSEIFLRFPCSCDIFRAEASVSPPELQKILPKNEKKPQDLLADNVVLRLFPSGYCYFLCFVL